MPKLLLLSSEFPPGPGGIGTQAWEVARNLCAMGWEVRVMTSQDYASEHEIKPFNQEQPFSVIQWPSGKGVPLQFCFRLFLMIKTFLRCKPDLVLSTGDGAGYVAWGLRNFVNFKWVWVEHGRIPKAAWEKSLKTKALKKANKVIFVSQYTAKVLKAKGFFVTDEAVIPNGADPEKFYPLESDELCPLREKYKGKKILLTVGNVTHRKGQEIVIRAMEHVIAKSPQVHYLMAGLPTLEEKLFSIAKSIRVHEHIHFLGKVSQEDLVQHVRLCDLFLMTSCQTESQEDFEGYGIAAIEAALCEKASIVSDNSGLAEAVLHHETGLVVAQGSVEATAKAILELLQNEDQRNALAKAARKRALREQTWAGRVKEYDQLLRQVISF